MTGFAVKLSALLNFIFNNPVVYKYFCLNFFKFRKKSLRAYFKLYILNIHLKYITIYYIWE